MRLPEQFLPALQKLISLSDGEADALLRALQSAAPLLSPRKMAKRLWPSFSAVSEQELTRILSLLGTLESVRARSSASLDAFIDDVCASIKSPKKLSAVDCERVRPRLKAFLQIDTMAVAAKAVQIQREHTNVFIGARIYSDIRPVFSTVDDSVSGAIVVHKLKLTYLSDDESHEIYIAIDDDDVEALQKALARTVTKSQALRAVIRNAGLADLERIED